MWTWLFVSTLTLTVNGLDLANWMSAKRSTLYDRVLTDMTFPGTHDSATDSLTSKMMPGAEPDILEDMNKVANFLHLPTWRIVDRWSKAQPFDLLAQLNAGVRYIDLRPGFYDGQWYAYHGLVGQPISDLMTMVKKFMDAHKGEVVLIEANGLIGDPYPSETQVSKLMSTMKSIFGDLLYPSPYYSEMDEELLRNETLWNEMEAKECATAEEFMKSGAYSQFPTFGDMVSTNRRVLLSVDHSLARNTPLIWHGWATFENTYAGTGNLDKMKAYDTEQLNKFVNKQTKANHLFKISWTLTPDAGTIAASTLLWKPHSLLDLATKANADMSEWVKASTANMSPKLLGNIFLYDNYPEACLEELINTLYP